MKVKVSQSCLTLCDAMDYRVHGILQAKILEWVVFPFSSRCSHPKDWTQVYRIAGGFFTNWAMREACSVYISLFKERLLLRAAGVLSVDCIQLQASSGLLRLQWATYPRLWFFHSYLSPMTDWSGNMSISLDAEDRINSHLGPTQYNSSVLVPEFPLELAKTDYWMHSLCFCQIQLVSLPSSLSKL